MDILTYIDRVKANYSKQPEPRYNTQKYLTGGLVTTPKRGFVDGPGSYGGRPEAEADAISRRLATISGWLRQSLTAEPAPSDCPPMCAFSISR